MEIIINPTLFDEIKQIMDKKPLFSNISLLTDHHTEIED
jgi:hypothetical protein